MLTGSGGRFRKILRMVSWPVSEILLLKDLTLLFTPWKLLKGSYGSHHMSPTTMIDRELEAQAGYLTPSGSHRTFTVKMISCPTIQFSRWDAPGIPRSPMQARSKQNQTRFSHKTRLPIVTLHLASRLEQMTKLKSIFQLALKNKPWPPKRSGDLRHNQPTASAALSVDSLTFRNEYCSKERLYKIFDAPDKTPIV